MTLQEDIFFKQRHIKQKGKTASFTRKKVTANECLSG